MSPETAGAQRAYTTVLFDLDGTLLPMDTDDFMRAYMKSLGAYMAQHGMNPQAGIDALFAGVKAMAGEHEQSNHDVFWRTFCERMGTTVEEMEPLFTGYYAGPFSEVGAGVKPNPDAGRAVAALRGKGYTVAVATMPMFPTTAVRERIRWAGLDPDDFAFVTDYERCSAVKPHERFYRDVLARAGAKAEETLMVGNHNREDGFATKLGCDIYFVDDHLIEADDGIPVAACKHGTMADFAAFCEALPPAKKPAK